MERGTEGNGGIFSFSYINDSYIPPASKSSHLSRGSTGNSLVSNSTTSLKTHTLAHLYTYTKGKHLHVFRIKDTH